MLLADMCRSLYCDLRLGCDDDDVNSPCCSNDKGAC